MPGTTTSPVGTDDQTKLRGIIQRLSASWAAQDADAMAEFYAEDATVVLPGDNYLKGRPAIRAFMAGAFEGRWKDTHVFGIPQEIRSIGTDTCLVITRGGAHKPGATDVSATDAIRAIWVFVKRDGEWTIAAYENTPLQVAVPISPAQ